MMQHTAVLFSLLTISTSLVAESRDTPDMLQLLQEDMQVYSKIATQTRQNVDYMPYIISAWDSAELDQLGISTLREALSLVPGVDLSVGTVGIRTPIFRGSNPFAMGQSKLVIDGVVVNDKMTGSYSQFLDMPVDIIQRIEVVRGPGSLLSYVNGYAGSIHVITKANRDDGLITNNNLFAELGSSDYRTGGFVVSHKDDDLSVSSDFYYKEHDRTLPVPLDRYGNSGEAAQWLENYNLGINADYKGFSLIARLSDKESGASYGQSFSLSEDESDFVSIENNYFKLAYSFDVAKDITGEFSLGYVDLTRQLQNKVIPDGGEISLPDGRYFLVRINEETLFQRIELNIDSVDSHQINLGLHAYQSDMREKDGRFSTDDLQTFTQFDILIDTPRRMYSLFADDLIDLSEQTSIQLGIKYDHYSDVENQASPRIAVVHRYDNENIFKFMYTHSYREPAWREQYLNVQAFFSSTLDIKPELVDAYELGYIRKLDLSSHIKFNIYYLSNKDQIHAQNPSNTFQNSGNNNLYGLELEYKSTFQDTDQIYFNYSYVDGNNVADELATSASHMIKGYYIHNITNQLSVSAIAKYIDEKGRTATDLREKVDSYSLFDLSINYSQKPENIDINLSIKNLFNERYFLPSPENTYPDDFEQQGRSILLGLKKRF